MKVTELERKIAEEMRFARDAHAVFCTRASEADVRYEYFYIDGLRLYADGGSYYKLDGGERWTLRECSDSRVSFRLPLMEDGELVYAPVLFVPLTEVKNCTLIYQDAGARPKRKRRPGRRAVPTPEPCCASSGESMLNFLKTPDNTIVIGTNSGGYQLCGNDISMTLPNTGMYLYLGVSLTFPCMMENVDYKGYEPDVWCSADTSLDAVLNMMVRYKLTDQATANIIAGKAAVKDVAIEWDGSKVRPGQTFGTGSGEYVLYPTLDGKRVTDFTVRNENPEVATVQKAADGSVELTVMADGSARLTFTVNGKDYTFYWYAATPD